MREALGALVRLGSGRVDHLLLGPEAEREADAAQVLPNALTRVLQVGEVAVVGTVARREVLQVHVHGIVLHEARDERMPFFGHDQHERRNTSDAFPPKVGVDAAFAVMEDAFLVLVPELQCRERLVASHVDFLNFRSRRSDRGRLGHDRSRHHFFIRHFPEHGCHGLPERALPLDRLGIVDHVAEFGPDEEIQRELLLVHLVRGHLVQPVLEQEIDREIHPGQLDLDVLRGSDLDEGLVVSREDLDHHVALGGRNEVQAILLAEHRLVIGAGVLEDRISLFHCRRFRLERREADRFGEVVDDRLLRCRDELVLAVRLEAEAVLHDVVARDVDPRIEGGTGELMALLHCFETDHGDSVELAHFLRHAEVDRGFVPARIGIGTDFAGESRHDVSGTPFVHTSVESAVLTFVMTTCIEETGHLASTGAADLGELDVLRDRTQIDRVLLPVPLVGALLLTVIHLLLGHQILLCATRTMRNLVNEQDRQNYLTWTLFYTRKYKFVNTREVTQNKVN